MQAKLADLNALGASVVAASADPKDKAEEAARNLGFPVAYGVDRGTADTVGAWWEGTRNFCQPAEFVIGADGKVVSSTYSSGPIGRVSAEDLVKLLQVYASRKA